MKQKFLYILLDVIAINFIFVNQVIICQIKVINYLQNKEKNL